MWRLFVILLAFFIAGVPEMRACRVYGRVYYRKATQEDVPQLCRDEGIVHYMNAWSGDFGVDLKDSIKQLRGLIDSGCSDDLGRFLCTAHFPQLDLVRDEIRPYPGPVFRSPCVETCRAIWRDCRHAARQLGIERLPELRCSRGNYLSETKTDECFSYLKPPRDQPLLVQATRLNASSASILYTLPEEASMTETFRVHYNETVSWGQVERDMFHTINRSYVYGTWNVTDLKSVRGYRFEVTAMNTYGVGPKAFVSVPAFEGDCDIGTDCEDITLPMCRDGIGYQQTALPNSLAFWDQDTAGLDAQQFSVLVEFNCSSYTQTFLCAMYTPRCTSDLSSTRLPCKDLCVQARNGCDEMMHNLGFSWPYHYCENLPRYHEDNNCYLGGAPLMDAESDDRCEDITVSWCPPVLGYNRSWMPNSLGQQRVRSAEIQLMSLAPIAQVECSPHFSNFVCTLYLPRCSSDLIIPCRELCEEARNDCSPLLQEYGFPWPEQLACEDLPSHTDGDTCYLGDFLPTTNETDFGPTQSKESTDSMSNVSPLAVKPRRYDVHNLGVPSLFHGWADVQGQGAANDYCRVVRNSTGGHFLSCSLAGMEGPPTDLNYNSTGPEFDAGHMNTWYMRDVNEDGRDDYCRCIGFIPTTHVSCLLAGEGAFTAQTLNYDPVPGGCHYNTVNPFFGR